MRLAQVGGLVEELALSQSQQSERQGHWVAACLLGCGEVGDGALQGRLRRQQAVA
jgi:hypothetical protein